MALKISLAISRFIGPIWPLRYRLGREPSTGWLVLDASASAWSYGKFWVLGHVLGKGGRVGCVR